MKFEIVTLFPDYFSLSLKQSLIGKAIEKRLFDIAVVNPREHAVDKHRTVDDTPFGGGGGMVMKIEPLDRCLQALGWQHRREEAALDDRQRLILTSASGRSFDQKTAIRYSLCDRLTIVCGHYLGVDERLVDLYRPDELSIGDYILTGGEPAALVIIDAVARLMPKVLGNFESAMKDAYMDQLLGSPCWTRPAEYAGMKVPEVLLSGNHAGIDAFRRRLAIRKCLRYRPDLLDRAELSAEELAYVEELKRERKNDET